MRSIGPLSLAALLAAAPAAAQRGADDASAEAAEDAAERAAEDATELPSREAPRSRPSPAPAPGSRPARAAPPTAEGSAPASAPVAAGATSPDRLASLLGGRPLGVGGSAAFVFAGFPGIAAAYAQGLTEDDDLGASLEIDLGRTEFLVAGLWRRGLWRQGPMGAALVLRAGLYANFGADYVFEENRQDTGVGASPALAFSVASSQGLFSVTAEVPLVWTFERDMGWVAAPRLQAAFEVPLYGDLSVGVLAGGGFRSAGGGAPGADRSKRALVQLGAIATYRLF